MATITRVAADVRPLPGAIMYRLPAAEAIGLGQAVYVNGSGQAALADADTTGPSQAVGIVVSAPNGVLTCVAGDVLDVLVLGRVTGFTGMTPGGLVYTEPTAGALNDARPAGASGDFVWIVGRSLSATVIFVNPFTDTFAAA